MVQWTKRAKTNALDNHADFSRRGSLTMIGSALEISYHASDALPFPAPSFFSFHRETAAARGHPALRFLGM